MQRPAMVYPTMVPLISFQSRPQFPVAYFSSASVVSSELLKMRIMLFISLSLSARPGSIQVPIETANHNAANSHPYVS